MNGRAKFLRDWAIWCCVFLVVMCAAWGLAILQSIIHPCILLGGFIVLAGAGCALATYIAESDKRKNQ